MPEVDAAGRYWVNFTVKPVDEPPRFLSHVTEDVLIGFFLRFVFAFATQVRAGARARKFFIIHFLATLVFLAALSRSSLQFGR